jgi:kinesin family protein 5
MSENIQVVVRFRPLNEREISTDTKTHIKINTGDNSIVITDKNIVHDFKFDYVFDYASSQEEIYKIVALTAVESVCHGYNATIFAYGSSGSGKTFTMFGNENQKGIIPNACQTIFKYINNNMIENNVKCSFIEIYNERIRDLFNVHSDDLHIRQNEKGVYIQYLTEKLVYNSTDILNCIKSGSNQRMISATSVNDVSSRSHAVLTITITQIGIDGSEIISKLNLVDLAGSENVGRSEAHGMALTEAQNINKSLSALGNVINALTDSRRGHIPYRDSKLTYFLQDSLGGNSKTIMIATVSPATSVVFETLNTIKFAKRAKDIKNIPKLNRNESTINLLKTIEQLNGKIELLQEKIANYQGIVENIESKNFKMKTDKWENKILLINKDLECEKERNKNLLELFEKQRKLCIDTSTELIKEKLKVHNLFMEIEKYKNNIHKDVNKNKENNESDECSNNNKEPINE